MPSVAANDSCRPAPAAAYGFITSRNASAAVSAVIRSFSRPNASAIITKSCMISARVTEAPKPAIAENRTSTGTAASRARLRRPNSSVKIPVKKLRCMPDTTRMW